MYERMICNFTKKKTKSDIVTKKCNDISSSSPLSSICSADKQRKFTKIRTNLQILSQNKLHYMGKISHIKLQSKVYSTATTKNKSILGNRQRIFSILPMSVLWKQRENKKKSELTVRLLGDRITYNQLKYEHLKELVENAIRQKKIFTLFGKCRTIRSALKQRGWVEKLTFRAFDNLKRQLPFSERNEETESKIKTLLVHNLIQRNYSDFVWLVKTSEKPLQYCKLNKCPLINRIKMDDKYFTTKAGLCSALKNQHWFHINGISDVNSPRSYNLYDSDEFEDFHMDYRITSCTNLLKWFIQNRNEENNIMSENGKIVFSVIFFALKRCQAFIQQKQHKDIDKIMREPKETEWDSFIESYNKLLYKKQKFKLEHRNVINFYIICSKEIIKFMRRYRPEIDCEGHNNVWIIKPGSWSRGRGIKVTDDFKTILAISKKPRIQRYVVQKYIENPLLIYGTKFDIRQYYIITSTHPLIIWMYKNAYLRFSSQNYTLGNFHESIHLTNNAIQHKYKNNRMRNSKLPENNMWTLEQYKNYLKEEGCSYVWNKKIYPGMKMNIIGTMLNCQDGMINRINQFEMYGCDFILDRNHKPWLIEINSCPDMSATTKVTAQICPQVMEDIIKVVVDHRKDPQASTGDFECIYRQKMTPPIFSTDVSSLVISGEDKNDKITYKNDHNPPYKESCEDETLRKNLPWKHELIRLQSEEDFLKHELIKIQSDEETLVFQYTEDSKNKEHELPSNNNIQSKIVCSSISTFTQGVLNGNDSKITDNQEDTKDGFSDGEIDHFKHSNSSIIHQASSNDSLTTLRKSTSSSFKLLIDKEKIFETQSKSSDILKKYINTNFTDKPIRLTEKCKPLLTQTSKRNISCNLKTINKIEKPNKSSVYIFSRQNSNKNIPKKKCPLSKGVFTF